MIDPFPYSTTDSGDIPFIRYIPTTLKYSDTTYRNGQFK